MLLLEDPDPEIRETADETLNRIPVEALQAFLARSDVPIDLREFFGDRGIFPAEIPSIEVDEPLIDTAEDIAAADEDTSCCRKAQTATRRCSCSAKMSFPQRLKAAMKGTREMRAILIRDPNKMICGVRAEQPEGHRAGGREPSRAWRTCRKTCCGSSAPTAPG